MPYTLTDDEQLIRKVVREFAEGSIGLEQAADFDRHDRFPAEAVQAAAGLGLTALTLPAELGGAGAGPTAYALAIHELAKVCPNTAAILAVHNGLGLRAILANPQLAAEVAPKAAAGELVAVLATEEAHGSDVGSVRAVRPRPAAACTASAGKRSCRSKSAACSRPMPVSANSRTTLRISCSSSVRV